MPNFYLYLIIAILLTYIFGFTRGVRSNRVVIGGESSESGDSSFLSFLFPLGLIVLGLYFIVPPEYGISSLFSLPKMEEAVIAPDRKPKKEPPPDSQPTEPNSSPQGSRNESIFSEPKSYDPSSPRTEIFFQTGAFRSGGNAANFLTELEIDAANEVILTADGFYRACFGAFASEQAAENFGMQYHLKGHVIVVTYD